MRSEFRTMVGLIVSTLANQRRSLILADRWEFLLICPETDAPLALHDEYALCGDHRRVLLNLIRQCSAAPRMLLSRMNDGSNQASHEQHLIETPNRVPR